MTSVRLHISNIESDMGISMQTYAISIANREVAYFTKEINPSSF